VLVTKKVMPGDCGGACCAWPVVEPSDAAAIAAPIAKRFVLDIVASLESVGRSRLTLARNLA
jgi:hypothetical protein